MVATSDNWALEMDSWLRNWILIKVSFRSKLNLIIGKPSSIFWVNNTFFIMKILNIQETTEGSVNSHPEYTHG